MRKLILTAFICLLFAFNATAQIDSVTFVKARWETKKIAPGLHWKHYWFKKNLFGANQNINILEINPHRKIVLALAYEKQVLKPASAFAKQVNAIAAINGSFFDVKNGGAVDMIKVDGNVISGNKLSKSGERAIHQQAALLFNKGILSIAKWDGTGNWENKLNGDVMNTGPLLVYNNNTELLDTTAFVRLRHPRTAVAVTHNRILLITVDGRNENSAGVNLFELAKLLKWLKATDGINLDGGGSTTMWINGQTTNGVVNYPTDNKKWDHEGERKVANAVLVKIKP
jgi:exopolysaccharide biosynthesis protein